MCGGTVSFLTDLKWLNSCGSCSSFALTQLLSHRRHGNQIRCKCLSIHNEKRICSMTDRFENPMGEVLHIQPQMIKSPPPGSSAEFTEDLGSFWLDSVVLSCEIRVCSRFQFHAMFSDESVGPVPGCWQVTGPGVVHSSTCVVRTIAHGCRQIIPGACSRWLMVSQWRPPIHSILKTTKIWSVHETRALFSCCWSWHGLDKSAKNSNLWFLKLWAWMNAKYSQIPKVFLRQRASCSLWNSNKEE